MQAPNVQLYPGSTDTANVKKLQDYLVSLGLLDKGAITGSNSAGYGIYGPKTTEAVRQLQIKLGVDTSAGGIGNYGPLTSAAATKTTTQPQQTQTQQQQSQEQQNVPKEVYSLLFNGQTKNFNSPQELENFKNYVANSGQGGTIVHGNITSTYQPNGTSTGNGGYFYNNSVYPNGTGPLASQFPSQTNAGQPVQTPTNQNPAPASNPAPTQTQPDTYNPFAMGTVNTTTQTSTPIQTTAPTVNNQSSTVFQNVPEGSLNFGDKNYLTPDEFSALQKTYYDEQTPYYDALQSYDMAGYDNTQNSILGNYNATVADYTARAQEDLDSLNDSEGKNGTWASSERLKRRTNLQDKYNRSFQNLYNQNVDNLYKNRLDRAYQYGDSNVGNNSGLQLGQVNFGDTYSTPTLSGNGGVYNPFGFQGRKNVERQNNAFLGATNQLETFTYPYKYKTN